MKDRFKFRVWKGLENRMVDNVTHLNPLLLDESLSEEAKYNVLMQCTGLKDKNGKLIYEGDIVNVLFDTIKPHYMPFVVIWDRKEWQLVQINKNYKKCDECANNNKTKCSFCKKYFRASGHTNFKDFYNGIVIGNIYENPELLEAKND